MNILSKVAELVTQIQRDYPALLLETGAYDSWSPETNTITYKNSQTDIQQCYSLLHELAHASLGHNRYINDLELLQLEVAAWQKASELAKHYGLVIDKEHLEDCLDSYRDWLHRRSTCPSCSSRTLQQDSTTYHCFNCGEKWDVTANRLARTYRSRLLHQTIKSPAKP